MRKKRRGKGREEEERKKRRRGREREQRSSHRSANRPKPVSRQCVMFQVRKVKALTD
tara:strand:- start:2645 stop:2815 length:171 start_codon:yes stop_codon:yes gene_type:complete